MKNFILACIFISLNCVLFAQEFNVEMNQFDKKKISYVIMSNAEEIEIKPTRIKMKKGLIEEVIYKNENGDKVSLPMENVTQMYVPFSDFAKLNAMFTEATNLKKLGKVDVKADILEKGYAHFIKSEVMINKKKKKTLLLQTLNPTFGSKIMVFLDPFAAETGGIEYGGIQMTGGDTKSYYIKVGDAVAYRLHKKNYKDEFEKLFGDCKKMKKEFTKVKWTDFSKHVYFYETECN